MGTPGELALFGTFRPNMEGMLYALGAGLLLLLSFPVRSANDQAGGWRLPERAGNDDDDDDDDDDNDDDNDDDDDDDDVWPLDHRYPSR